MQFVGTMDNANIIQPTNKLSDFLETGPALHRLYDKHRSSFAWALGILPIIVAYSRPKNIGDLTTQAKLFQAP